MLPECGTNGCEFELVSPVGRISSSFCNAWWFRKLTRAAVVQLQINGYKLTCPHHLYSRRQVPAPVGRALSPVVEIRNRLTSVCTHSFNYFVVQSDNKGSKPPLVVTISCEQRSKIKEETCGGLDFPQFCLSDRGLMEGEAFSSFQGDGAKAIPMVRPATACAVRALRTAHERIGTSFHNSVSMGRRTCRRAAGPHTNQGPAGAARLPPYIMILGVRDNSRSYDDTCLSAAFSRRLYRALRSRRALTGDVSERALIDTSR
ncbi:hypothetical protein EVAR_67644_1 [Eumeta japonica]|uniref:Uncharacterized protein n=1 Tax=Eumeta variegata TaxID=151549 RepID=A0A4C1ZBS1_EUMVA|nr:hypothetical protein EVAR_67644_1 [Eumeta japonica]